MLMNEMMKTRIMASFLNENDNGKGYLTVSSFTNVVKQIIDDVGEEDIQSSLEYFSLNVLSDEFTCNNEDWYAISDQLDCWGTIVQAMLKKGKLMYFMDDEDHCDFLVAMELLGTTVIFNCLDGIVGMFIHKASIDQFVKDANLSR
jgi:hypothetical protein